MGAPLGLGHDFRDGRWAGGAEEVVVFAGSVWESSYTGHSAHTPPANWGKDRGCYQHATN